MDTLTRRQRSERLARVRGCDTVMLSLSWRCAGVSIRLHGRKLPWRPNLVFVGSCRALFVRGCFWLMCGGCALARMPMLPLEFG
ncbi:MAG: hypothetical protein ACN6OP_16460 [Pseudomonadales bacterium]|nr:hypothetical protein [Delftia sp. SD018]